KLKSRSSTGTNDDSSACRVICTTTNATSTSWRRQSKPCCKRHQAYFGCEVCQPHPGNDACFTDLPGGVFVISFDRGLARAACGSVQALTALQQNLRTANRLFPRDNAAIAQPV